MVPSIYNHPAYVTHHTYIVPSSCRCRLFRKNEELLTLFEKFSSLKISDDLRGNEILETHGMLVMEVLDECIEHLDDVDRVEAVCTRVGKAHARMPGFNSSLFWVRLVACVGVCLVRSNLVVGEMKYSGSGGSKEGQRGFFPDLPDRPGTGTHFLAFFKI